jgi:hypothetical protein
MSVFSRMSAVTVSDRSPRFEAGRHLVELSELKLFDSRDGIPTFVVSGEVAETTGGAGGIVCAQVIQVDQKNKQTKLGNIKQLIAALMGVAPDFKPDDEDPDQFWENAITYYTSKENPAKGTFIRLTCEEVQLKNARADGSSTFLKHSWGPVVKAAA